MVEVDKDYTFVGPNGRTTLEKIFEGRDQLVIYHCMFAPEWDAGCKGCSFLVDQLPRHLGHLNGKNTTLALISRAPYEKLAAFKKRMDWTMPWYSSESSKFNMDFYATRVENVKPLSHISMAEATEGEDDVPGVSVFMRGQDGGVYQTYSSFSESIDRLLTTYAVLDFTPLGRQEGPKGPGDAKYHDEF